MVRIQISKSAGQADNASYTEGSVGYAIRKHIGQLNAMASSHRISDIITFLDVDIRADVVGESHVAYLNELLNDVKRHQKPGDFMFNYRHLYNLYLAGTGNGGVGRNIISIK